MRGVRDACDSPEGSATKLEDIESILDRVLSQNRREAETEAANLQWFLS
jgi:hypothetical protein